MIETPKSGKHKFIPCPRGGGDCHEDVPQGLPQDGPTKCGRFASDPVHVQERAQPCGCLGDHEPLLSGGWTCYGTCDVAGCECSFSPAPSSPLSGGRYSSESTSTSTPANIALSGGERALAAAFAAPPPAEQEEPMPKDHPAWPATAVDAAADWIAYWSEQITSDVWDRPSLETREEFKAALASVLSTLAAAPAHDRWEEAIEAAAKAAEEPMPGICYRCRHAVSQRIRALPRPAAPATEEK